MRTSLFALQAPVIVARDLGSFAREGIPETEYRRVRNSVEQLAALAAGDDDVALTAADNLIEAQLEGRGLRLFHVADLGLDQFAVAGAGVTAWEDVRGRAIGVDSPTSGYAYVLYRLLADHGIARDEVEVVPLGGPDGRFAGLADGSIAVGMLNPFFTERARRAGLPVLASGGERFPAYPNLAFAASETRLAAEPALFAAYARAIDAALAWVGDDANTDEAVRLVAAARDVDEDAARGLLTSERSLRLVAAPDGAAVRRALETVAALRGEFTGRTLAPEEFATAEVLAR